MTGPAVGDDPADDAAWARARTDAAAARAAHLERARRAEGEQAAVMLRGFAERARRAGLRGQPLEARDLSGRGGYRSDVTGWYLRVDRSAAVDEQGGFYLLRTAGGSAARLLSRWRPVHLTPSPAPLVLGRGGRDGDSVDLADALARVLCGQER